MLGILAYLLATESEEEDSAMEDVSDTSDEDLDFIADTDSDYDPNELSPVSDTESQDVPIDDLPLRSPSVSDEDPMDDSASEPPDEVYVSSPETQDVASLPDDDQDTPIVTDDESTNDTIEIGQPAPSADVVVRIPSQQLLPRAEGGEKQESIPPPKTESSAATNCQNESSQDDGQSCTICFDSWTTGGEHRLVSLRCGHLFGRNCITRWLKGSVGRCPQCNARSRKSEIRNIYAKAIVAMDCGERDKALKQLQAEKELRGKAEQSLASEKVRMVMLQNECEVLKMEVGRLNKIVQEYRCGGNKGLDFGTQSSQSKCNRFTAAKVVEICKEGGCRLISVSSMLSMIAVSQPSINKLFPGYGFRKVSPEMRPEEYVLIHQKPIKDMAFHPQDGLILTASLDKSVRITNVFTNSIVQTYPLEADVWSCIWDEDDPKYFYAGLKNGAVMLFDIRSTAGTVSQLPRFGCQTPAVSLDYLKKGSFAGPSNCGPVVGKLSDCGFYRKMGEGYEVVSLPSIGPCTSLSSEPNSGHLMISCRPSARQPRVTHTVCELVQVPQRNTLACNPVQAIKGGKIQVQLTRSLLVPNPANPSSLIVCSGDEESLSAKFWDSSTGGNVASFKTESAVLDMGKLKMDNDPVHVFFALTDKFLHLYNYDSS